MGLPGENPNMNVIYLVKLPRAEPKALSKIHLEVARFSHLPEEELGSHEYPPVPSLCSQTTLC